MTLGFVKDKGIKYVVELNPIRSVPGWRDIVPYKYLDALYFNIAITNKSVSKMGRERGYCGHYDVTGNTFNMVLMRSIEKLIRTHLEKNPLPHLFISPYPDEYMEKRLKLYVATIERMGYRAVWGTVYDGVPYVVMERR